MVITVAIAKAGGLKVRVRREPWGLPPQAVYAGDALEQQLRAAGLPAAAVAALRSAEPWKAPAAYRDMLLQALPAVGGAPGAAELRR
jgi:hypothetical protein